MGHRYGPEAGALARDTLDTAQSVATIGRNVRVMAVRGVAKHAGGAMAAGLAEGGSGSSSGERAAGVASGSGVAQGVGSAGMGRAGTSGAQGGEGSVQVVGETCVLMHDGENDARARRMATGEGDMPVFMI